MGNFIAAVCGICYIIGKQADSKKTGIQERDVKPSEERKYMDIELNYCEQGTGFPLILLHGNGESLDYFSHQITYFSKSFRVIAVDTRGHGRSPRGERPFTISQFAEDLREFMDGLGIEKAHILGFSDGGNIALTFALRYPERVERLVLNGANLNPSGVKAHVQLPIVLGYRIASLFAGKSADAMKNAELLGLMVNEPDIRPEELRGLQIKTLVIAGKKDMIKESHTRLIGENLPAGQLEIIDGDHFIANKNPDEFNRVAEKFLIG